MNRKKEFWYKLENSSLEYQNSLNKNHKKENGIYYTGLNMAYEIIKDVAENLDKDQIWEAKFLEPCVGIGNFVFSYLRYISEEYSLDNNQIKKLLNNIYVNELDRKAIEIYKKLLREAVDVYFDYELPIDHNYNIGGPLVFSNINDKVEYVDINTYFGDIEFDIIVTNPPYKNLRAEKRFYDSQEEFEYYKEFYNDIKNKAASLFTLSPKGGANLYKYFVEEILTRYSTENTIIGLLIPSSMLTNKSCTDLRKYILFENNLKKIVSIPENNEYIKASQAMSYFIIKKRNKTNNIYINKDITLSRKNIKINIEHLIDEEHGHPIIVLNTRDDYELLNKLKEHKKLKAFPFISNKRGELDISNNKQYVEKSKTKYKLLKGRHIQPYQIQEKNTEYVNEEFLTQTAKKKYIFKERIACQQISNTKKNQRLQFAPIKPGYVLANSCNFITVEDNEYGIDLYFLLAIMNSKILNWYFKLFSSNNHVNNYEIDSLPIPTNKKLITEISKLMKEYVLSENSILLEQIDEKVNKIYLTNTMDTNQELALYNFDQKLTEEFLMKEEKMENNYVLNNYSYSLSELDREIIGQISPGGNWKDIKQETVDKSKRLQGIQKSGGRTTLYGRLEYDLPSYTVTTYFNRPGNGTNIHPELDRVLTTREAARLQAFPDDYLFIGNQKDIKNQLGNAVPPLIGYIFGRNIIKNTGFRRTLDLFSGAGGLLEGFKQAGMQPLLANDIEKSACKTLQVNHPDLDILNGDLTDVEVKEEIIKTAKKKEVEIICGGPPCQGFSMAGFRKQDDPRNKLIKDFVDVVGEVRPKLVMFENVLGFLSYNKGKTFEEFKLLFDKLGYDVYADKISFNEYGVPQRRKRVILVAIDKNVKGTAPIDIFPKPIISELENQVTVREAIYDLKELKNHGKNETIISDYQSEYIKLMTKKINAEEYLKTLKRKERKVEKTTQLSLL